jgi:hypothetical protein
MQTPSELQNRIAQMDRRLYAALVGLLIGVAGGLVGLSIALLGPVIPFGILLGVLAALYVLTDVSAALYGVIAIMALLPFGTFPVRIGFTPTLLDLAMGAFLTVYLLQWATGRRRQFRTTPVHLLILLYMGWLILAFAVGLRYGMPTSADLRQFAETLLSISMVFILVDLLREPKALRRLVLAITLAIGAQALVALVLYAMPDETAERTLVRLARLGSPNGGVIRYIEDDPAQAERAIGTWVDPNAFGGVLSVMACMIAPQLFAEKPVLRRWLAAGVLGVVVLMLVLTFSRTSMVGFAVGLVFIAAMRYRKILPLMLVGGLLLLLLPQTQAYIERFTEGFSGADLATQMRIGEYTDSLRLISQYPVFGIGFTGSPSINLYTDVASLYLIMANQIGAVGVGVYLLAIAGIFAYGFASWRYARRDTRLTSIHLGFHAALLTAVVSGVTDHYFFRSDFQASITLFWIVVALALSTSRLALEQRDALPEPAAASPQVESVLSPRVSDG